VVPAELLRKPLPADIPFRCVWSPPYHVLDVVFYLND
jgi:hypothetical protein